MATYKIVKADDSAVTSTNSRELKRRIKGTKYRKYTDGIYHFLNKKGKICFAVEYTTKALNKDAMSLKGRQFNIE